VVGDNRAELTETIKRINSIVGKLEHIDFDDPQAQADVKAIIRNLKRTSDDLPGLVKRTDANLGKVTDRAVPLLEKMELAIDRVNPVLEDLPHAVERITHTLDGLDRVLGRFEPMLARADTIDYSLIKKLLRDEGLLVRFKPSEVTWERDKWVERGVEQGVDAEKKMSSVEPEPESKTVPASSVPASSKGAPTVPAEGRAP
jgi:hypothetical protein